MTTTTPIIYICTVGTGTRGATSDVSRGIANAILIRQPQHTYLVPSDSAASRETAEFVRLELEEHGRSITPWQADTPWFTLSNHDGLLSSRREMRCLLRELRQRHEGASLVINPTGGTKQMTTAAVLAAIDEGIADIEYITGPRQDGVIITGKEEISSVSGRAMLAGIANRQALELLKAGAYLGAETLVKPYSDLLPESTVAAQVLGAWDRFSYGEAHHRCPAAGAWSQARSTLKALCAARHPDLLHLADMLQACRRWLEQNRAEEALARLYRIVEAAGKLHLTQCGVHEPWHAADIAERITVTPTKLTDRLARKEADYGCLLLGMSDIYELLSLLDTNLGMLVDDARLNAILQYRNQTVYGHGIAQASAADVKALFDAVYQALKADWPDFEQAFQRCRFPAIHTLVTQEVHES